MAHELKRVLKNVTIVWGRVMRQKENMDGIEKKLNRRIGELDRCVVDQAEKIAALEAKLRRQARRHNRFSTKSWVKNA